MAFTDSWRTILRSALLAAAAALTLNGCGTSPRTGPSVVGAYTPEQVSAARNKVVRTAEQLIGTPYRYGGNNRKGFDCSGLVQYTHRKVGVKVPRTTGSQWDQARVPQRRNLLPGDLLFFNIGIRKTRHVGIYEGDGIFIHAPSSGKRVSRASLENPYWGSRLVAAKTFL